MVLSFETLMNTSSDELKSAFSEGVLGAKLSLVLDSSSVLSWTGRCGSEVSLLCLCSGHLLKTETK